MTDRPHLLYAAPHDTAESLEDLLGVANAIEVEAVARYDLLAEMMERRGEIETAAVFLKMAEIEKHHVNAVARRAASLQQAVPPSPEFIWRLPPELGDSWDEVQHSSLLTPYRALAIAVTNEERAFAFYSYVAAQATDRQVAELAESLALDELTHASELRVRRRMAYHREFHGRHLPAAARVESLAEFRELERRLERQTVETHREIANLLTTCADAESAALLAAMAQAESTPAAAGGGSAAPSPAPAGKGARNVTSLLHAALRPLETASEVYENLIARAEREDLLEAAQSALRKVVERISILGRRIREIEERS
ncbi:MAG: ferritin family protein [Kiloniellaceae bacterium]